MDSNDVVAQATEGYVKQLAFELDVSLPRMYELLSKDNAYPKLWRWLRPLARLDQERLRMVQADFDTRCEGLYTNEFAAVTGARLHKELSDVVQAHLGEKPPDVQRRELVEAKLIIECRLMELLKADKPNSRGIS